MANNNDWHTPGASLTLPFGSVSPYVVISGNANELPADLIAFYAGFGETVVAGIVFQSAGTAYDYQVFVTAVGGPAVCFGGKSNAGNIIEACRYSAQFATAFWDFGLHGGLSITVQNGGDLKVIDASSLVVEDSSFDVRGTSGASFGSFGLGNVPVTFDDSDVTITNAGQWFIDTPKFKFENGSHIVHDTGSVIDVGTNLQTGYVPYTPQRKSCSAALLTTNAYVLVPGCTANVDIVSATDRVFVDLIANVVSQAGVADRFEVALFVDGVQKGSAGEWDPNVAGITEMVCTKELVTGLAPGVRVFEMRARTNVGVANQYSVDTGETKMIIDPRYGV